MNQQEGVFVNWGEGNRWQFDPIELKKSPKIPYSPVRLDRIDLKRERLFNLRGMFPLGRHPLRCLGTAAPTDTAHSTAYPGRGSSKTNGVHKHNFSTSSISQARREPGDRSKHRKEAQDFDGCIAVAVPCVAFRASSAHSREAESDCFLACVAKKTEAVRGEHAMMHAVARICSPRYLSAGCLCEMLLFSDVIKFREQYVISDRTHSLIFPPNRIDLESIEVDS